MADKDKVKKGFGFYLMMLLLVLVAAFLIIVMVMLFNKDKVILGYKFFSNDGKTAVSYAQTTDAEPIDFHFATLDKINVTTGYADVKVVAGEKDSISVSNGATGFAKAAHNTRLSFSARESIEQDPTGSYDVLNVSVVEPEGFLYFSHSITVTIIFSREAIQEKKCELNITTASGDITFNNAVGNISFKEDSKTKSLKTLSNKINATTSSGDINFQGTNEVDGIEFTSLYLTTGSGAISIPYSLKVTDDVKIVSDSGTVNINKGISTNGEANFDIERGKLNIKGLAKGEVKLITRSGVITIDEIQGSFDTNHALNMDKASIKIEKLNGDVSIPIGNRSSVNIGQVNGNAYINTTSGAIKIGSINKTCEIESTSGAIDVGFIDAQNTSPTVEHNITSQSGAVNFDIKGKILSQTNIKTNGKVSGVIDQGNQFDLYLNTFKEEPINQINEKIVIDFIRDDYKYGMSVNNNENSLVRIVISSDNNIEMKLRKLA